MEQLTELIIDELVERYLREMARYELAAAEVANRLRRELRAEARFRHVISFRAKHPEDLREKLRRKSGEARYSPPALRRNLNEVVTDLAGCRVLVYSPEDETRVTELIDRVFETPPRSDARPAPYRRAGGYQATHRLVQVPSSDEQMSIQGAICEIQVTTVAAHLFNELEHDTTYKEHGQTPSQRERDVLNRIRHLVRVVDEEVTDLLRAHEETRRAQASIESPEELRFVLEHETGHSLAGEFSRLYQMLERTVSRLNRDTLVELGGPPAKVIDRGGAVAKQLDLADTNDVIHFALGLGSLQQEFARIAGSWRGPRTALRTAIERWANQPLDAAPSAPHNGEDAE